MAGENIPGTYKAFIAFFESRNPQSFHGELKLKVCIQPTDVWFFVWFHDLEAYFDVVP